MTRHAATIGLSLGALGALGLAALVGPTALHPLDVGQALLGGGEPAHRIILWEIRIPRALAAFLVGGALGLSGAAMQGLLRNPLAEPGVLGVSATASLCASVALYYGLAARTPWLLPAAAVLGALLATALIAAIAVRTRAITTLILVGVGLSSFAGAAMSLLLNLAPTPFYLADLINWTLGSVTNRSFVDLAAVSPLLLLGAALIFGSGNGFRALTLGEETARGLGLPVERHRLQVVLGTGLLTGAAVALAGAIGFVGIVAPHFVRPLVRHDPARSLLPAALLGGLLLMLADSGIRLLPTTNELKLGVAAALIGAPVFVWIALQRGRRNG